jgi:hypothetical protein
MVPAVTVPIRQKRARARVKTVHVAVVEVVVVAHWLAVAAWKSAPAEVVAAAVAALVAVEAAAVVAVAVVVAVAAAAVAIVVVEQLDRSVSPFPAFRESGLDPNCLEWPVVPLALLPAALEVSNPDLLGAVLIGSEVSLGQWRYPTTVPVLELALVSALEVEPSLEVVMAVRRAMIVGLAVGVLLVVVLEGLVVAVPAL